jgi:hypothetical protein
MGIVLVVAAGFLIGGVFSSWQQSRAARSEGQPAKARQLLGLAAILLVFSALAAAGGILRL